MECAEEFLSLPVGNNKDETLVKTVATAGDRRFPPIFMDNRVRRLFFPPEKLVSKYVSAGKVVADLGCGPGYFTLPIAKIVGRQEGGKVYAVDFDAKSIERLTAKVAKHGFENTIEARVSSASSVGFIPDASVDFVFANGLFCCMTDHLGAATEINRILKKELRGSAYLSITKFVRKSDPRALAKDEWIKLVSANFNVLGQGESFASRWVHVSSSVSLKKEMIRENGNERASQSACSCI